MKRQSGFTLVEIAIVLVVIGLLLGGVLKGQELVLNAQIRNAINEYNNVASARFAYQDRYRQIPGDDATASTRWTTATNGNGDRVIDGDWNDGVSTSETAVFWHHLRNDSLVVGARVGNSSFQLPRNSFDGDTGVQTGALGIFVDTICQSNVPVKAAIIIDTRIDDDTGDGEGADTGSLQAAATGDTVGPGDTPATVYDTTSTDRYTMCREL
ncbi:MAG: prepilin-type N-terminal cleavage/methylation domain-containing protein [Gammaproteobacteria bacterium]|nr:prepilin-type N-terminal cleavage/methylation domain-containing protein [Gammaproteobacteria bacterium]